MAGIDTQSIFGCQPSLTLRSIAFAQAKGSELDPWFVLVFTDVKTYLRPFACVCTGVQTCYARYYIPGINQQKLCCARQSDNLRTRSVLAQGARAYKLATPAISDCIWSARPMSPLDHMQSEIAMAPKGAYGPEERSSRLLEERD